jgi:hypothetical protein
MLRADLIILLHQHLESLRQYFILLPTPPLNIRKRRSRNPKTTNIDKLTSFPPPLSDSPGIINLPLHIYLFRSRKRDGIGPRGGTGGREFGGFPKLSRELRVGISDL